VAGSRVFSDTFVFFNRARDRVKILRSERHGFWLCYQRFERGRYREVRSSPLGLVELNLVLEGTDLGAQDRERMGWVDGYSSTLLWVSDRRPQG